MKMMLKALASHDQELTDEKKKRNTSITVLSFKKHFEKKKKN